MTRLADARAQVRAIQTLVGVTADGVIGPKTLAAIAAALESKPALAKPLGLTPGAKDVPHFATMAAHLEREEGRVPYAYQDNLGFWTAGVGRLIDKRKGGGLSDDEIDYLLANDIRKRVAAMEAWPAWQAVKDDPVRSAALLSMAFQMGVEGLAKFKNSLRLVAEKQWQAAAANMMESLWAKQTPARAKRVTQMIATGKMQ